MDNEDNKAKEENILNEPIKNTNLNSVATELYKDVASPAAKELSKPIKSIAELITITLKPISGMVWGYNKIEEYIQKKLSKKLQNIPTGDITTPPISIAGPLIESLRFNAEEPDIRNLYINLLAASMHIDDKKKAHPAFVEIIKQLSSDEAKLLTCFSKVHSFPYICEAKKGGYNKFKGKKSNVEHEFEKICTSTNLINNDNFLVYLDNLYRLRILELKIIPDESSFSLVSRRTGANNNVSLQQLKQVVEQFEHTREIESIFVTTLGQDLIRICID